MFQDALNPDSSEEKRLRSSSTRELKSKRDLAHLLGLKVDKSYTKTVRHRRDCNDTLCPRIDKR